MSDDKQREDGFYEEWGTMLDTLIARNWGAWEDNLIDMATAIERYEVLTEMKPEGEEE